jgi:hypothetical protein
MDEELHRPACGPTTPPSYEPSLRGPSSMRVVSIKTRRGGNVR